MKKVFFLFAFVLFGGLAMNAQCTKSTTGACCASKKMASSDVKACAGMAMVSTEADAAAKDANVQKRISETTGKVSYFEKSVCPQSKSVTWSEVAYDATSKKFTKVASASMERNATTGEVKEVKPACMKEGSACCKGKKTGTK